MSSCQRCTYARAAAIILYDFCQSLDIPATVYGHSTDYIGHIENARGIPSLEMVVKIANALEVTVDQLLSESYKSPEVIYLREIAERIEKYPVSQRIQACEGFNAFLGSLEKFGSK